MSGFGTASARNLEGLVKGLRNTVTLLTNRRELHTRFEKYVAQTWQDNLFSNGNKYGKFKPLRPSTVRVRQWRGQSPFPPMVAVGTMAYWVNDKARHPSRRVAGPNMSSVWIMQWSGAKDGSYAVLHDQGYTAGGAGRFAGFSGKQVPQRKLFDISDNDLEQLAQLTREFVMNASGGVLG